MASHVEYANNHTTSPFTNACKVSDERLPEVLARKGAKYQPPGKDGKPPARKQKEGKVNAVEADTPPTEPSAREAKLNEKLEILQARLDQLIPDPKVASVSAWMPHGMERDSHVNGVNVTLSEEGHQRPLSYAGAAKRALEPDRPWEQGNNPSQGTPHQGQLHSKTWDGRGGL